MEQLQPYLPYIAYFAGAAFGVLWPYLRKYLETGEKFNMRAIGGKVAVALLGLLLVPQLDGLEGAAWLVAFGMGVAATTVGHEAQRTPAAIEAARGGE